MDQLDVWAMGLVATPWIYLAVFSFAVVDGFFPPIPSESLVIAVAALGSAGTPNIAMVGAIAAAGAFVGDQMTFQVGRWVKVRKIARGRRATAVLDWATAMLARRGSSFVIGARFVPIGRVAVNAAAGTLGYPRMRFLVADVAGSVLWAVYLVVVGLVAGKALGDHPVVAVTVGIIGGLAIGVLVDRVLRRLTPARSPEPVVVADVDPDAAVH
ncbi:MAG: DedA family protein [Micrococcales bacterium]|nr:DedA family protein [Micrococcales bacterium]